jgi:hypothetical protein
MDQVPVHIDAPWEEEMALASIGPLSFYHVSFFPKQIEKIFNDTVMLNGGDPQRVREWQKQYLAFLKKIQLAQPGQRLLLKNPANTARLSILRQMFPRARFVHIHRNPYRVFTSTVHLYRRAQQVWGLHPVNDERIVRHVVHSYKALMTSYLEEKKHLRPEQLCEISFADLQQDPLASLSNIYQTLNLPGYDDAKPKFAKYLDEQQRYQKNDLPISEIDAETLAMEWQSIFKQLGYSL